MDSVLLEKMLYRQILCVIQIGFAHRRYAAPRRSAKTLSTIVLPVGYPSSMPCVWQKDAISQLAVESLLVALISMESASLESSKVTLQLCAHLVSATNTFAAYRKVARMPSAIVELVGSLSLRDLCVVQQVATRHLVATK
jgi:hypothetical protein